MNDKRKIQRVLRLCRRYKKADVRHTDFINQYHKYPTTWKNKVAYLAGLVDGEGYLKVEKWGTIRLMIGMTHRTTIYWIRQTFGGSVTTQKTPKGTTFYVWRMNQGKDLFYLLLLLLPFVITKKVKLRQAFYDLVDKFSEKDFTLGHTVPFKKDR